MEAQKDTEKKSERARRLWEFTSMQSRFIIAAGMMISAGAVIIFLASPVSFDSKNSVSAQRAHHRIRIGGAELSVEYASDEASRARGLSGRESLGPREGMLFIFPFAASYGFWMKDMRFDIDIAWIRNSRVIGVSERVPAPRAAEDSLPTYYPPDSVDMVLEVQAGAARELGIKMGDAVSLLE